MTNEGPTRPALPSSSANRLSARELLALVLGRDVVSAPGVADNGGPGPGGGTLLPLPLQLFVLSFLMLFVELALIRWSGALVIYLSYFSNFVLLGSFLGIGIGFLRARSRVNLFRTPAPVLWLRDVPCQRSAHVGHAARRVPGRGRRHGDDR